MVERQKAAVKLLVSNEQFAKSVEPTVCHLDNPAPCLLLGVSFEFISFLPSSFDMGDVAMLLNDLERGCSCVTSVSTQMLVPSDGWVGTIDHDGIKHCLNLRHIMPIGSCHDERQRDATPVHQQVKLASFFPPDRSDWVRLAAAPTAP